MKKLILIEEEHLKELVKSVEGVLADTLWCANGGWHKRLRCAVAAGKKALKGRSK